jgi:ribosomal protein S18 acetylase RimI-like enzyme
VMALEIRALAPEDKSAVMRLLRAVTEFKPCEVTVAGEVIDSYLASPSAADYRARVAEVDPDITGYICYGPTPLTESTWDIYWLAVAPTRQGRGIGRALIAFAEDEITQAGGKLIIVETSSQPGYERARRFYQGQGYQVACRLADFYAPGDDKLVFRKQL